MPGPYSFPTDRVTGGPAPADDVNALGEALNEAASAATPNVLALRDANGRFQAEDPSADDDVATKGWVTTQNGFMIPRTVVNAKGDLIVATGDDAVARLAVGTDGQVPIADSSQTTGIRWGAAGGGSGDWGTNLQQSHWGLPSLVPWSSGQESLDSNRFYGQRFRVGRTQDYDRYAFKVNSGAAGANARVGMYKLVSGTWTLDHDAGVVSVATTGVKEITVDRSLAPGDYVVGLLCSDFIAVESMKFRHGMGMRDVGGNPIFGVQFPRWWSVTQTYGALPSTLALAAYLDWDQTFSTVLIRGK